jgi:hypothetical protein
MRGFSRGTRVQMPATGWHNPRRLTPARPAIIDPDFPFTRRQHRYSSRTHHKCHCGECERTKYERTKYICEGRECRGERFEERVRGMREDSMRCDRKLGMDMRRLADFGGELCCNWNSRVLLLLLLLLLLPEASATAAMLLTLLATVLSGWGS